MSYAVILELYMQLKRTILSELTSLRPNQLELLNKAFAEIDSGNPKQAFASLGLDYQT